MIHTDRVVVVEGRYDRLALERVLDGLIVQTDGFGIFQNVEKQQLLRRLAQSRGLIVLTDGDSAGRAIRGFVNGLVPPEQIVNLYVPDRYGKEKRKKTPSKEGKLGVEGMSEEILREAFVRARLDVPSSPEEKITSADLYRAGLSGCPDSAARRVCFQAELSLPEGMSPKQLLAALNCLMTREEFLQLVEKKEKKS